MIKTANAKAIRHSYEDVSGGAQRPGDLAQRKASILFGKMLQHAVGKYLVESAIHLPDFEIMRSWRQRYAVCDNNARCPLVFGSRLGVTKADAQNNKREWPVNPWSIISPIFEARLLHQRYKDICFFAISKATVPNYWVRKYRYTVWPAARRPLHLHLGCGPNYLPGFVNIDANPMRKIDMWLDVRCGLPFASQSVDSIYSTHMIEHLYPDELEELLQECARVLKPGAGLRLIVPSLRSAVLAYHDNRRDWFCDSFPRHFNSLGGRFSNFVFCDGQHRTAFDFGYLEEMLGKTGFDPVQESAEGRSRLYGENIPSFDPNDNVELPRSLYVEAFK